MGHKKMKTKLPHALELLVGFNVAQIATFLEMHFYLGRAYAVVRDADQKRRFGKGRNFFGRRRKPVLPVHIFRARMFRLLKRWHRESGLPLTPDLLLAHGRLAAETDTPWHNDEHAKDWFEWYLEMTGDDRPLRQILIQTDDPREYIAALKRQGRPIIPQELKGLLARYWKQHEKKYLVSVVEAAADVALCLQDRALAKRTLPIAIQRGWRKQALLLVQVLGRPLTHRENVRLLQQQIPKTREGHASLIESVQKSGDKRLAQLLFRSALKSEAGYNDLVKMEDAFGFSLTRHQLEQCLLREFNHAPGPVKAPAIVDRLAKNHPYWEKHRLDIYRRCRECYRSFDIRTADYLGRAVGQPLTLQELMERVYFGESAHNPSAEPLMRGGKDANRLIARIIRDHLKKKHR